MKTGFKFVVTITNGKKEWDCIVHDPSERPITWGDIQNGLDDPKCPFQKGETISIKSNWVKP